MSGKFDEQTVQDFGAMVAQISREYHRKYKMVEREDIVQELWLWFATHTRKLEEWNTNNDEQKTVDKLIAKSLRNAAYDYCIKEKARVEGYSIEDVFFYKKEFIKMLLPAIIANDWDRVNNAISLGGKPPKAPSESNDWMAYVADIKLALHKLSDEERKLVEEFYGNDITGSELHEQVLPGKTTARAAVMQANRALNKMVKTLGGFPPFKDKKDEEYE